MRAMRELSSIVEADSDPTCRGVAEVVTAKYAARSLYLKRSKRR
jgi:hypothetical protein